ncbi:mitochondrial inner membrane protease ATP23 homolog [Ruditapes philippinarum]|uniref:mitochondrial inner membrane protease ATP23 homolog n=2 Tax=Ruditapes philippinarum TaxID=129788 RepID=UPI00295B6F0F|nr:mitochondrial inner membrane protease ATP23 homolog [Ruditapes philippinarum]
MAEKQKEHVDPPDSKAQTNEQKYVQTYQKRENDDYGYSLFPNRSAGKVPEEEQPGLFKILKTGDFWSYATYSPAHHQRCRTLVRYCTDHDDRVKMMMRALKAHGCPVDVNRHIYCEPCKLKMSGGFDFFNNQVVVCQNVIKNRAACCNVLSHEMLHAFDHCRAKLDISNIEHMACTEVRAANMFHCTLVSAFANGEAKPWNYLNRHVNCVKRKAMTSIMVVRNVTEQEASDAVDKVFNRCYNDLEPFGRRIRKGTDDDEKSLKEGILYGYMDKEQ